MADEKFLGDKVELHCGDCLTVLPTLAENSIDACVTDPPYHLTSIVKRFGKEGSANNQFGSDARYQRAAAGFMGKQWDGGDIAFRPDVWREVYRVLKPGAHLLAFGGTRTYHRLACAIEDAGFEIRDSIMWVYGSGFPKSHDVSKGIDKAAGAERQELWREQNWGTRPEIGPNGHVGEWTIIAPATAAAREWEGWGTALKPACEPIVLARKPLSEGTVAANVLKWGTGALNIDGARVPGNYQSAPGGMHRKASPIYGVYKGVDVTGQRPYNEAWENGQNLCDSCAALAVNGTKLTTPGIKESIATNPAAPITSARELSGRDDTGKPDIGCSDGMKAESTSTNLNTEKCGKKQMELSRSDTKSTTSMETKATTDLLTCASCGQAITEAFIKQNMGATLGRWPSNLIHDGSEEVMVGFPETGISAGGNSTNIGGFVTANADESKRGVACGFGDSGSAARFFYTAKADADDRLGSRHPTVKPLDLMQYLCRLVCKRGGTILDPFAGTGTTGEAAWREGMHAVLIEREAEYQAEIRRRMAHATDGPDQRAYGTAKEKEKHNPPEPLPLFRCGQP